MSREIKFRAWDDFQKEMLDGNDFIIDFYGQPHEGCVMGWVGYEENERLSRREVKLMQSTGLKDKTGKEIWEGDIIGIAFRGIGGVVEFNDGAFVLHHPKHGQFRAHDTLCCDFQRSSVGVLGNIYENPDVLETHPEKI